MMQMTAAGWLSACIIYRERCSRASNDTSLGRTTRGLVVMTHAAAPRKKNNSAHKSRSSSPQLFEVKTILCLNNSLVTQFTTQVSNTEYRIAHEF